MHLISAAGLMKTPWPWYSKSRSGGGWFVKLNGTQHFLGKHPVGSPVPAKRNGRWNPPNEVLTEFYRLMSLRDTRAKDDYTVETICALHLEEIAEEAPSLAERYKPILGSFCDFKYKGKKIGKLLVNAELDEPHLVAWSRSFASVNTRRTYINCCKAAMKWAVKRKHINVLHNPLSGVAAPKGESGAEVITRSEHDALLEYFTDSYQPFLKALWFTGARPGEIARIEARHLDDGLWRLSPCSATISFSV